MCLLFALWFASGIVMMYVEYPELTEEERLDNLLPLDSSQITIDPSTALALANPSEAFSRFSLISVLGRPAYQFNIPGSGLKTVFADSGEVLNGLSEAQALQAAEHSGFTKPDTELIYDGVRDFDQWSVSTSLNVSRPLHRIKLQDAAGTVLYISDKTGNVVRDTNRTEMLWNWVGSFIHWIYPWQLRQNASLWADVIIYLSLIGIFSVITGAIIGFMRIRIRKPYRGKDYSPYLGMMKWHHILGLLTLVFVSTFIFSGLMSMGPWGVFDSSTSQSEQIQRYTRSDLIASQSLPAVPDLDPAEGIKEVRWHSLAGEPYLELLKAAHDRTVLIDHSGNDQHSEVLLNKLEGAAPALLPDSDLVSLEILRDHDDYYYSRHNRYRPLPIYRAKFSDEEATWYHIDITSGAVVNRLTDRGRLERWLYNGLHSLDFRALIDRRPLWDVLVIVLSLIGLGFSITSVVVGWRRLVPR